MHTMQKGIALAVAVLLPILGWTGVSQAQSAVQIQGTIQAVDCQAGTVTLSAPTGSNTVYAADFTAVLVNSASVPFCNLQSYIGAAATVWLVPSGNQFSAAQINVVAPVAVAPPAPPAPVYTASPVPIWGVVLGTIAVAGLVYLLVHGPDGYYYRYPYYGPYRGYYYRPYYRPYAGYYPPFSPVVTAAAVLTGAVLGVVVFNHYPYLLARDGGGHFYRYPYFGPYREYYYRAAYRPYAGRWSANDAPVRHGDPRWDDPRSAPRVSHGPVTRADPPQPTFRPGQPVPARNLPDARQTQRPDAGTYQPPAQQPNPAYQRQDPPRHPNPAYQQPRQPQPTYQRPVQQPNPAYQRQDPPRRPNPAYQQPRRPQPTYRRPVQQPNPAYQRPPQRQLDPAYRRGPQGRPYDGNQRGRGNQRCSGSPQQACNNGAGGQR